jgi:hypothetical protein
MTERNELVTTETRQEGNSSGDAGSSDRTHEHAGAAGRGSARLKSAQEIQAAAEHLLAAIAVGFIPEKRGRALLQGLRLQLQCLTAAQSDAAGAAGGVDTDAAASLFEAKPELLQALAPTLDPTVLGEILGRLR